MKIGAFSLSLTVKDINISKAFYEQLGFTKFGGDLDKKYRQFFPLNLRDS